MNTATKTRPQTQQQPQNENAVAVIQPPRLPYHPAVQQRFGLGQAEWRTLTDSVFPSAKSSDAIILALSYCKARRLDIFKRPVHIVPIWDSKKGAEVETVWPGIAEHRTTATRTGTYAGMDPTAFGPMVTEKFVGEVKQYSGGMKTVEKQVTYPEWAQITVYRMVQGQRVPFPGPKVYWKEFYAKLSRFVELPNDRWERAPSQMLEKCAEAGALRRAFPEELGEDWTVEEVGFFTAGMNAKDITSAIVPTQEPTREQFKEATRDGGDAGQQQADQGSDDGDPGPSDPRADAGGNGSAASTTSEAAGSDDGWPLYSHVGEEIGSFGLTEWIDVYDRNRPKAKPELAKYVQANLDAAKEIASDTDTPEPVKKQLGDRFGPPLW